MKKTYYHILDFCFSVESPNADYATIPREVLLKALKDRVKRIEDSGEDTGIGLVDTEEKYHESPNSGKRYKEIIELGCNPIKEHGDFECGHHYDWTCDECPIVVEMYKRKKSNDSNTRVDSARYS